MPLPPPLCASCQIHCSKKPQQKILYETLILHVADTITTIFYSLYICSYAFMKVSAKFSSITLSPGAGRRTQTQPVARSTTTPELSQLSKWPPTPHPPCATTDRTSPPQPTMHPTLLGKLRLGSPSAKHVQYSAVNRNNSRTATTALHEIQQSAPFPKLPPYYTTGSDTAGWNGGTGDWNGGTGGWNGGTGGWNGGTGDWNGGTGDWNGGTGGWNGGTGDWNGDTGTGDNELSSVEKQTMRKAKGTQTCMCWYSNMHVLVLKHACVALPCLFV